MFHEMKVYGFTLDSLSQRPVIILKDAGESHTVPIWLNSMEAVAMAASLIGQDISEQKGGGDLFRALLGRLRMRLDTVAIEAVKEGAFTASVRFAGEEGEMRIEVSHAEALLTALRFNVPVMVADEVVRQAARLATGEEEAVRETDARRFADYLENLDPATLGKYPM